jgi:hypothetical protein
MIKVTLEVGDLFSVFGAHGIERQLQHVARVGQFGLRLDDRRVRPGEDQSCCDTASD